MIAPTPHVCFREMEERIQTLYCTTDIGAERPIHKCGNPMSKASVKSGHQVWRCAQQTCNAALRRYGLARRERYANDPEYRGQERERSRRTNRRKILFGNTYLGMAETPEQAYSINALMRERLWDLKSKQREEYANHFGGN